MAPTQGHERLALESALRKISVPRLVRLKVGALTRLPIYLNRESFRRVLLLHSTGLPESIISTVVSSFSYSLVEAVEDNRKETIDRNLPTYADRFDAVVGVGGGKALDVAKLTAFRLDCPYFAAPTSLSNDGFCSPQSSLLVDGRRKSVPSRLPTGVVIDLEVVRRAPMELWLSGVGDLVAKWTAVQDWKLAFHHDGTPFDDLSALLSDASVFQFLGHPKRDYQGIKLLAQALLLNGVAMEIAGSSRPASGSEHLISHALDHILPTPRLHGLQVGLATYWMMKVQGQDTSALERLFEETGFWGYWKENPLSRETMTEALEAAPDIKDRFVTILTERAARQRASEILNSDPRLKVCLF